MNVDIENIMQAPANRIGKSAKKGLGGAQEAFAQENFMKGHLGKDSFTSNPSGRVKLGVLAKSNVVAGTPLRKAAPVEDVLKQCSGDDLEQFVKSTSAQSSFKPIPEMEYPPVEYGYVTKLDTAFDEDLIIPEPAGDIVWERDEEDEARVPKEISEEELEAILDWI